MKAWWLDYHPAWNTTEFLDTDSFFALRESFREGNPLTNQWVELEVELRDKGKPADFLRELGGALVVSKRARNVMEQLPNLNVEFLPLKSKDGEFSILNVLTVLDCIDMAQSNAKSPLHTIYDIKGLALVEDIVQGHDIYKIKLPGGERSLASIFVSDRLREIIESQLEGFQLINMWDSEFTWQQQEAKFAAMCLEVDASLQTTFNFDKAVKHVKKHRGDIAYSGQWAIKTNEKNSILLGDLLLDGTYSWIDPIYFPPIILGLTWGIKEKKKSLFGWR
ncbi:hypothetical protein A8990_11658 [Paenibacillus taihuensis]|uniref:Immunity MXAN-0049 protein domain-containing protein n=1 Tax=Paenibacillus taihuensis TaxID=1156355 RepID=A0A3D9RV57_9BACL|nr:DUF1629 domain-containing protein [Paenibacillus taihuensis]REE83879.1 hypothetical protein A8990_11658 [Paenibacillus taihuensis]